MILYFFFRGFLLHFFLGFANLFSFEKCACVIRRFSSLSFFCQLRLCCPSMYLPYQIERGVGVIVKRNLEQNINGFRLLKI